MAEEVVRAAEALMIILTVERWWGMYRQQESIDTLWAITDCNGAIMMSRGGSSSKPKIMVYPTRKSAERALNNSWTKQIIDEQKVKITCIYDLGVG